MLILDSLVPGFEGALDRTTGARSAWRVLSESVRGAAITAREAALVHVAVAHLGGGDYARWAIGRLASRAGLSGEDALLASAGTAMEAREAAIVHAARDMAAQSRLADAQGFRRLEAAVGAEAALQVLSHVALALLACDVLDRVAPGAATATRS